MGINSSIDSLYLLHLLESPKRYGYTEPLVLMILIVSEGDEREKGMPIEGINDILNIMQINEYYYRVRTFQKH